MNSNSASPFRKFINRNAEFDVIVDFGAVQPFKGVDLATNAMIATLRRGKENITFRGLNIEGRQSPTSLAASLRENGFDVPSEITATDEWRFQSVDLFKLSKKLYRDHTPLIEVTNGEMYSGTKTGLTEVFLIDSKTRSRLISENSSSTEIIKPILRGQDIRPWYQHENDLHIIFTYHGINIANYPAIERYLQPFQTQLEARATSANHQWYELQQPQMGIFPKFEKPKIIWPDIARFPRFAYNEKSYLNNTCFMIGKAEQWLLAMLQSRALWFALSQIATPLNIRLGLWRYRVLIQFVERLPIPNLSVGQESELAGLAEEITGLARGRYELHEKMRGRIAQDLGAGGKLNQALESWWELDAPTLHEEVKKVFKRPIRLSERDEWEKYLADQQAKHAAATAQIVEREIRLNAIVYEAFKLETDEIGLIETATKYPYGAV